MLTAGLQNARDVRACLALIGAPVSQFPKVRGRLGFGELLIGCANDSVLHQMFLDNTTRKRGLNRTVHCMSGVFDEFVLVHFVSPLTGPRSDTGQNADILPDSLGDL